MAQENSANNSYGRQLFPESTGKWGRLAFGLHGRVAFFAMDALQSERLIENRI